MAVILFFCSLQCNRHLNRSMSSWKQKILHQNCACDAKKTTKQQYGKGTRLTSLMPLFLSVVSQKWRFIWLTSNIPKNKWWKTSCVESNSINSWIGAMNCNEMGRKKSKSIGSCLHKNYPPRIMTCQPIKIYIEKVE